MQALLSIITLIASLGQAQPAPRAELTLLIRDEAGVPLAGVRVALGYDGDAGRVRVGERTTDAAGTVRFDALPYGTYIISFLGNVPDGRPILPAERQNLGLLRDGNGAASGFGLRVAAPEVQQLFVLATVPGEDSAIPMFDLAPGPRVAPTAIDPFVELARPSPTALANAHASSTALPSASVSSQLLGLCLVGAIAALAVTTAGLWRSAAARRRALGALATGRKQRSGKEE